MCCAKSRRILAPVLLSLFIVVAQVNGQDEKDPHRPACTDVRCRKIQSFLKAHYCGESPYGNGPDDGCLVRRPKKLGSSTRVTADFDCKWSEGDATPKCQQHAQPSSEVRSIIVREMRQLGLPAHEDNQIYFTVWKPTPSDWSLAEGYYSHFAGDGLTLCQVIVIIDQRSHVRVLRKLPFQKTDSDVPAVTTWSPLDLADVDGDGQIDAIFEADDYENHWIEVDSVKNGVSRSIFSGLGYYL